MYLKQTLVEYISELSNDAVMPMVFEILNKNRSEIGPDFLLGISICRVFFVKTCTKKTYL